MLSGFLLSGGALGGALGLLAGMGCPSSKARVWGFGVYEGLGWAALQSFKEKPRFGV